MRYRSMIFTGAVLAASAAFASAQQSAPSTREVGSIDFGIRFTDVSGDEARFQRFRDIGDGAFLERFRYEWEREGWLFQLGADHVGRTDQRYFGRYKGGDKLQISFQWDQTPLFISQDTRTLHTTASPGVLRIDDAIQQGIESNRITLGDVVPLASGFDTKSRRDIASFNFVYTPARNLDVKFGLKTTHREGTMPWGATFGFANDVEVPAPIDTRTTDATAAVEWVDDAGMLRVAYDGSWFTNGVDTMVWDNPWRFTDSTSAGSSQGRLALWPGNSLQNVSASGSLKLPARSRFTGNVVIGSWRQDAPLLPFTINSAIPAVPLDRTTAEAEARTLAMNYVLNSRPNHYVWLNARYRYYDFDNRTPSFAAGQYVRLDQTLAPLEHGPEALSQTRQTLDLDASFTPLPFSALKVGYTREQTDRTFRIFGRTTEDVFRASLDTTGSRWVTLRAIYEHSSRRGTEFDEEPLDEAGEQPEMRHYDIADRDRNRVSAVVVVTPAPTFGLTATAAVGQDDYKNSGFGLLDNRNRAYTVTADLSPTDQVAASLSYSYESYAALQSSRNAAPGAQFEDPTRDWGTDSRDKVHTVSAYLDLLKLLPRTELRLAYDFSRSRMAYVYTVVPGSTLVAPQQLPLVDNEIHSGTADFRYFVTTKIALGFMYWYDGYRVDDFALSPETMNRLDLPGSLFLGYLYRPYTSHSAWVRLMYFW